MYHDWKWKTFKECKYYSTICTYHGKSVLVKVAEGLTFALIARKSRARARFLSQRLRGTNATLPGKCFYWSSFVCVFFIHICLWRCWKRPDWSPCAVRSCLVVFDNIWRPSNIRSNNLKHFFCSRLLFVWPAVSNMFGACMPSTLAHVFFTYLWPIVLCLWSLIWVRPNMF